MSGRWGVAATLLVAVGPSSPAQAAPSRAEDLAVSAPPALTYRIPALVATTRGTLLAAFDRRHGSAADLPNHIDVMLRRSTDGGRTWSGARAIVAETAPAGCGDPSLLVDRPARRVFLFCTFSAGRVGFASGRAGTRDAADPNTLHIELRWSDDDGIRWSAPRDLDPEVKDPHWRALFASSGHGIQTASGRLLQPIVVRDSAGATHAGNLFSDDHGATWHAGALLDAGTDESKAVERSDGTIVQNIRPGTPGRRLEARSTDGGRTFGPAVPVPALPDPSVNGDIIRGEHGVHASRRALLFVNPASARARENLTLRRSCDGGRTWPDSVVVHRGPSGYASLALLPGGRAGIFFERGAASSFERLTFTSVPLAALGAPCR